MPDLPPPKRDRNVASLRLARACSIDTTAFALGRPLVSRSSPHPPVSPAASSHSASMLEAGTPITRTVSHQPSTASGKRAASHGAERTERWVEAAMEYELEPRQHLTSGMRKSFAIDEEDDDRPSGEDDVDRLGHSGREGRRVVTFAEEDTVELLPDDGMRLESFERPRGRELMVIITSCCALAALALTAGFATVYDWVL